MKRKTAKETLADSLRELGQHKNVEKITIKEITENCGYSPATFYRHFQDKYDLVAWDYARQIEENIPCIEDVGTVWRQTLLHCANYHYEHRKYLANLCKHISGLYSFECYMVKANYRCVREIILRNIELDKKLERYLYVHCTGCVKINIEWILGKVNATPEEMADVYEMTLPEPLKPYLLL